MPVKSLKLYFLKWNGLVKRFSAKKKKKNHSGLWTAFTEWQKENKQTENARFMRDQAMIQFIVFDIVVSANVNATYIQP